jgi:GT2 family glycosyltransferase
MTAMQQGPQSEAPALVRAVVLNYNRPQLTIRCAKSLLLQQGVRVDLVVVDNWSNGEQLRELRSGLPAGVALFENPGNLGYAAGNNTGLRAKPNAAQFALVLNNDAQMSDPATLARLVGALQARPDCAACSPLVRDVGRGEPPENVVQVRRIPNLRELIIVSSGVLRRLPGLRAVYARQVYAERRPFPPDSIVDCETINGCCFLIRTRALEAIGYLDEGTFLYCEELILGYQLRRLGLGCALVTQAHVDHDQGASAGRNAAGASVRGMVLRLRSERYFARKYLNAGAVSVGLVSIAGYADILCKVAYNALRRRG